MLTSMKSLIFACLLLALSYIAPADATCALNQWTGFYGTVSAGYLNGLFFDSHWAALNSPAATALQKSPPVTCEKDCQSNVVLRISTEVATNTFKIAVNGFYLQANGQWLSGATGVSGAASISRTSTIPGATPSSRTYFTGLYNNLTTQSYGSYLYSTGYPQNSGLFSPIYDIPYPNWLCAPAPAQGQTTTQLNSVTVINALANTCSDTWSLSSSRTCGGNVRGDPQFSGLRGQDYQVHGIDGGIYSIITSPSVNINSEFIYLTGPRPCPIIPSTGKKSVACFAHKGSYLKNLALQNKEGKKILIISGPAATGLSSVTLNDKSLTIGDSLAINSADTESIHYNSTHEVTIQIGVFVIEIENSDGFLNLRSVSVATDKWSTLKLEDTHGLLGQTWKTTSNGNNKNTVIEGKVDDYLIQSSQLFGNDHLYNKYNVNGEESQ